MLLRYHVCFFSMMIMEFFSFIFLLVGVYFLWEDKSFYIEWVLVDFNSMNLVWVMIFDYMSCLFLGVVMLISGLVLMYSKSYMSGDKSVVRFILVVLLFVLSMMMLILSPNMVSILLGWDGLGLVSYILVIYYINERSSSAGMLTAMSNRVGDVFLLLSISWMVNYGSWNFIFYVNCMSYSEEMTFLFFLVFLGAITKSAQIPFSAWLPAAMAAPTPVSALVHSSTLVTAGIYLMIRFFPLVNGNLMMLMMFISLATLMMSSLVANYEIDLSKIIALSTLSQLGLMMVSLSMGCWKLSFIHLLTHALFKSLLFLCAGVVIHGSYGFSDIRKMGGLVMYLPFTGFCMGLSNLALGGFPFLAGFYSKDMIIEFMGFGMINKFFFFFMYLSVGLTMMYSMRMIYYSLFGESSIFMNINFSEDKIMSFSMINLALGSVVGGCVLSWLMFPNLYFFDITLSMKLFLMLIICFGGFLGYLLGKMKKENMENLFSFYFGSMWFMPWVSGQLMIMKVLLYGGVVYKMVDSGWQEEMGSKKFFMILLSGSKLNQWLQNNLIYYYYMIFFIIVILLILLF
uniref:NADH-ubiquinone oxidoreductase chain 5 n=1 Tax=Campodea lubbockii TaxID=383858 RepID=Q0ZCZ8_9HEXA|nr:NADH dehydrogenase subunit 5 [Campodea lubbockii]ABF49582.1 NADH dehydrogenase subunit 5 [Campodea lubbockii]